MKVALNLLIRPTYFLFTLSVVFVLSLCPNTTSAESLATVNGIPISTQEYYSHYQRLLETHPNAQGKPKLENRLSKRALLPLVVEELLRQEANNANLNLDSITYDDPIIKLKRTYQSATRLNDYLKNIGEIEESLRLKRWSEAVTYQLMKQKKLLEVSEDEVRAEYIRQEPFLIKGERIKASQLLIKLPQKPTREQINEGFQTIQEIHKRTATEPFEVLIQRYSQGALRSRGGDMGFVKRGDMIEIVEKTIWQLKEGEISTPIRTRYGWHLIKRGTYQAPQKITYERVKTSLSTKLHMVKFRRGRRKFIKSLWESAKIDSAIPLRY